MSGGVDGHDVIVVGGGAAGLNGALVLARSRRAVLVIDAGSPRNAPADAVHGLLGHDGIPPAELLERGRAEVQRYGGEVMSGEVTRVTRKRRSLRRRARRRNLVPIASRPRDDGAGRRAPGCSRRAGALGPRCPALSLLPRMGGPRPGDRRARKRTELDPSGVAVPSAQLRHHVLRHTRPPRDDEAAQLASRGIPIVDGDVASIDVVADRLAGVRLRTGAVVEREVLVVSTRMVARAGFLADLGLTPTEHPSGLGEFIQIDASGSTTVPGIWAAGNVTDPAAQVGNAAAGGAWAAARINADLVAEDTRRAVEGGPGVADSSARSSADQGD